MAKSRGTRKSVQKKRTMGAKKGVGKKKSVSVKKATSGRKAAPPKGTVAAKPARVRKPARATKGKAAAKGLAGRAKATASGRGRKAAPPVWTPGQLGVSNGVVGLQTDALGFISLQQVADAGQMVGLAFPSSGSDLHADMIEKLIEFIRTHASDSITGAVTCCADQS